MIKKCLVCDKGFKTSPSRLKEGRGKFCSHSCSAIYTKNAFGSHRSDKVKKYLSAIQRGKHNSPKTEFKRGMAEEKHPQWKGAGAGRVSLHKWVTKHLGKPDKCEFCGATNQTRYEWANKSRKYFRELTDWIRLCVKCHRNYDDNANKAWVTRRRLTLI